MKKIDYMTQAEASMGFLVEVIGPLFENHFWEPLETIVGCPNDSRNGSSTYEYGGMGIFHKSPSGKYIIGCWEINGNVESYIEDGTATNFACNNAELAEISTKHLWALLIQPHGEDDPSLEDNISQYILEVKL